MNDGDVGTGAFMRSEVQWFRFLLTWASCIKGCWEQGGYAVVLAPELFTQCREMCVGQRIRSHDRSGMV